MGSTWLDSTYKGIHLDFHTPEFLDEAIVNFDPDRWVETFLLSNAQYVNLFAKCHHGNSYYNTEAGHKHAGLETDMLAELVPRLKAAGVRVVAYYSTNTDCRAAEDHPDWEQVDDAGNPILLSSGWKNVCFNSPYLEELMLPQLREITEGYDIDGYWLDMVLVMPGGCFCLYCRLLFEQQYGRPLTPKDKDAEAFRVWTVQQAIRRSRNLVRSIKPEALITANGGGTIGDHDRLTTLCRRRGEGILDYSCVEEQPGFSGDYFYTGYQSRYTRRLNRPLELINVRFVRGWGEWTAKPLPQMLYEASIMLAVGHRVTLGDQAYPNGTLDTAVYRRFAKVFDYLGERRPFVAETEPVVDTAILFTDGLSPQLRGADAVCRELHLQHDQIDESELEHLSRYQLLILPETGQLASESIERIRRFAESGGHVVVTGSAALDNDLTSLTGLVHEGHRDFDIGYFPADVLADPGLPLLVTAPPHQVRPLSAQVVWPLQLPSCKHAPGKIVTHFYPNPGPLDRQPAASMNTVGAGKVFYLAFDLFRAYWQHNHWWLKAIIRALIAKGGFRPLVKLDADGTVHTALHRRGDEIFLHLICFQSGLATAGGYPSIEHMPQLRDVEVQLQYEGDEVATFLEPGCRPVNMERKDGYLHAKLPLLRLYEVLRVCRA